MQIKTLITTKYFIQNEYKISKFSNLHEGTSLGEPASYLLEQISRHLEEFSSHLKKLSCPLVEIDSYVEVKK